MHGFTPSIKEISCAEKVVRYSKEKRQFEIVSNKKYFMDWAIAIFIIAVILGGVICVPVMYINQIAGYITLIIPVFFILAGARFYFMANNNEHQITIDLQKQIILHGSMAIPFKTIKQLSLTETDIMMVKNRFRIKKHKGWQINAEDHRGNKAPLVKSENREKIDLVLKEFSLVMGVPKRTV